MVDTSSWTRRILDVGVARSKGNGVSKQLVLLLRQQPRHKLQIMSTPADECKIQGMLNVAYQRLYIRMSLAVLRDQHEGRIFFLKWM